MRVPSGEICGSAANCRLNTSIAVRRSDFSWDLSSFFSCANPETNSQSTDSTSRMHRDRRCIRCAPRTFVENRGKCTAGTWDIQNEGISLPAIQPDSWCYRFRTELFSSRSRKILCESKAREPWAQDHKRLQRGALASLARFP